MPGPSRAHKTEKAVAIGKKSTTIPVDKPQKAVASKVKTKKKGK